MKSKMVDVFIPAFYEFLELLPNVLFRHVNVSAFNFLFTLRRFRFPKLNGTTVLTNASLGQGSKDVLKAPVDEFQMIF